MTARALVAATVLAGCLPPLSTAPTNVIDLRYRERRAASTPIAIYRWVGARSSSVGSRCKMAPTDSQMFAVRAARCGGLAAWYWGVARLFLEQASSSRYTPLLRADGRLRWLDLPSDRCSD